VGSGRVDGLTENTLVSVFGAAPDTGNLGVSALLYGTLGGLRDRFPALTPVVFDYGRGVRREVIELSSNRVGLIRCGARHTRRLYRAEALTRIRASARMGGLGNAAARLLLRSAAVLDLSGGDSFTDLYGRWRFRATALPKLTSLDVGRPLFLLPQTYGPFSDPNHRRTAEMILRRSSLAWARDPWSYTQLQRLLGDDFDSTRHREGVDVAFLLEGRAPATPLPTRLNALLDDSRARVAGVNVSGLLYNRSEQAAHQYGFSADYRTIVIELIRRFLRETDCSVVLIPHVMTAEGHYESDMTAALALAEELGDSQGRLVVAPTYDDPRYVKWLISRLNWFCGTRMHSTIAALSSGIAAAAIAYSDKTHGVFETCGQGEHVADLRRKGTRDIVDDLWRSWQARNEAEKQLAASLPAVIDRARSQMDELATAIRTSSGMVET